MFEEVCLYRPLQHIGSESKNQFYDQGGSPAKFDGGAISLLSFFFSFCKPSSSYYSLIVFVIGSKGFK
jgi:hypothetical protein